MKNFKYTVSTLLLISVCVAGFAFTPHRVEPVDIRADGMGGSYFTDSESFFTLFSNPAGLAFADEKVLFPTLLSESTGMSTQLRNILFSAYLELFTLGMPFYASSDDIPDIDLSSWETLFTKDIDFRMEQRSGPLTFGAIKNNSGWGFVQTFYINTDGSSLRHSNSEMGIDHAFVFGHSIPVDLGFFGKLSIGASGRGIAQIQFSYDDFFGSLSDADITADGVPFDMTLGFSFDVGVQYDLLNLLHVAIVWQDAYTPVWIKQFAYAIDEYGHDAWTSNAFEHSQLKSTLGAGIGLDIPLERITKDFISHFGIYADHSNLLAFFEEDVVLHDKLLEFSVGTELVLRDMLALRFGMNKLDLSFGLGIYLGKFRMDFSLCAEDVDTSPFWTTGISMAMHY